MRKLNYLAISVLIIIGCTPQPSSKPNPTPTPTNTQSLDSNQSEIQSISSGTSFGMCVGYCEKEVLFNSNKIYIYQIANRGSKETYPDIKKEEPFSESNWFDLLKTVDLNKFSRLPERIGCPDCADGGAEWIEIVSKQGKKRVTFEFNKDVPEIQSLVNQIRKLRSGYLDN